MKLTGIRAVEFLKSMDDLVELHEKDNTDKFWSYKIKAVCGAEFAFDPKTKTGLFIRANMKPPTIAGISNLQDITNANKSTALKRVFSSGIEAKYKFTVETEDALSKLIEFYAVKLPKA